MTVTNTPLPVSGAVTVANQPNVVVTNGAGNPVPTRDVGAAARQPFTFSANCQISNGNVCFVETPAIPAGKRLVLQYVNASIQLNGAASQLQGYTLFFGNTYIGLPPKPVSNFSGLVNLVVSEPVTMYVDAGKTIIAQASSSTSGVNSTMVLSGYLVDIN